MGLQVGGSGGKRSRLHSVVLEQARDEPRPPPQDARPPRACLAVRGGVRLARLLLLLADPPGQG